MLLNERTEYYFNKYSEEYDQQIDMLDTVLEAAKGQGYQVDPDTGEVIRGSAQLWSVVASRALSIQALQEWFDRYWEAHHDSEK